jgi:hypothetical protein
MISSPQVRNTPAIYKAFGFVDRPAIISLMLFQQIISPVDHVVGLLQNCLSRRFEFQVNYTNGYFEFQVLKEEMVLKLVRKEEKK